MSHAGRDDAYEVVLGPAAIRAVLSLPDPDRKELADVVRAELIDGPNAHNELRFDDTLRAYTDPSRAPYTATPVSFAGFTVVHRRLTEEELGRLGLEQGRPTASQGVYVIDILRAEYAFTHTVPGLT